MFLSFLIFLITLIGSILVDIPYISDY